MICLARACFLKTEVLMINLKSNGIKLKWMKSIKWLKIQKKRGRKKWKNY